MDRIHLRFDFNSSKMTNDKMMFASVAPAHRRLFRIEQKMANNTRGAINYLFQIGGINSASIGFVLHAIAATTECMLSHQSTQLLAQRS